VNAFENMTIIPSEWRRKIR